MVERKLAEKFSNEMETKHRTPSVIAKLMGFDEPPRQQPVHKQQRVLSESYLQKTASIGLRAKRSFDNGRSKKVKIEKQQEFNNVLEVPKLLKNDKHHTQSDLITVLKSFSLPNYRYGEKCRKFQKISQGKVLRHFQKLENNSISDICGGFDIVFSQNMVKSQFELKDEASHSRKRIVVLKPNSKKAKNAANSSFLCSSIPINRDSYNEVRNQEITADEMEPSRHSFGVSRGTGKNKETVAQMKDSIHSISIEVLKSDDRVDDTTVHKHKSRTRNEAFHTGMCLRPQEAVTKKFRKQYILEKDRSKPRDSRFRCKISSFTRYMDLGNNQSVHETQVDRDELGNKLENEDLSEENSAVPKLSCNIPCIDSDCNQPSQATQMIQDDPENNFEEDNASTHSEPMACNMFTREGHSCSNVWDGSTGQESSIGSPEVRMGFSNCSRIDHEFSKSMGEGHHPSPNSVLETPFKEGSECFGSVRNDLHDLWMEHQLLKSEEEDTNSEGPDMVASSDEESVDYSKEDGELVRFLMNGESRDFNYLIDVLDEMGFNGGNFEISLDRFHSPEFPLNPSMFESLEKKYGELKSWKKQERRLLFDRINSGLMDILQPHMEINIRAKPLRRRISNTLKRYAIEEDLWMLLVSQENQMSKSLSEKAFGRESGWLELGDDIYLIGKEIENFLLDELIVELAGIESV